MDRAKILSKIEKCMRLSKSSEPHEAAAALRQAQKMMEHHGVSEQELGLVGFGSESVSIPIQASKKVPLSLAVLVNLIRKAFGVEAVLGTEIRVSDRSYKVTYMGPRDRIALAQYSHIVIFRAMNSAWAGHLKTHPYLKAERGARMGFLLGWLEAIEKQVIAFAVTDEEKTGIKLVKSQLFPVVIQSKANIMRIDGGARNAGSAAASDFSLHRPMSRENLKIGM